VSLHSIGRCAGVTLICWSLTSCSNKSVTDPASVNNVADSKNSSDIKPNLRDLKRDAKGKPIPTKATTPIKKFEFEQPSPDWTTTQPAQGDGTFTKASYQIAGGKIPVQITSIGLPLSTKEAAGLVRDCETGFAQGAAKHPELTREWIKSGFSVSRYSDATNGEVVVWCVSESCKVELKYAFGAGSKPKDNVAAADKATDDFLEKNPRGGAQP